MASLPPFSKMSPGPNRRADDQAPWWARDIRARGPLTLIAGFLVYWLATQLTTDLKAHIARDAEVQFYLRAICLNTAATPVAQATCSPPERH